MTPTRSFRNKRRGVVNGIMLTLTGLSALLAVSTLFVILGYLIFNGAKSLDWNFFTKLPLPPGDIGGGMANAIVGSAQIILIASAIGLPIGLFTGIYLSEWGGKTASFFVRYMCDLLNGVPSIVIGIFAWTIIVVPMHHYSGLAGGIALSLMLIPLAAKTTEQFLQEVPRHLREGSFALGASQWKTVAHVVVPAASKGILTGMILGVARISGETAPLLFTSLNNQYWSSGLSDPTASLPVMIYSHAIAPYDDWHRQAWAAGLVLLTLVLCANIAARLILARGTSK